MMSKKLHQLYRRALRRGGSRHAFSPVPKLASGVLSVFDPECTFDASTRVVVTAPGLTLEEAEDAAGNYIPLWADRVTAEHDCSGQWFGPEPDIYQLTDGRHVFVSRRLCDC